MSRSVVVTLWSGARIVQRLGPGDPDPTQAELDAIATEWLAANDGVRPVVRVLEKAPTRRPFGIGPDLGPAGSPPPARRA